MSGGAFNDKLAKPLAEHGLFAKVENLFEPHPVDVKLMGDTLLEDAYATWPMGVDGLFTTSNPEAAIAAAKVGPVSALMFCKDT